MDKIKCKLCGKMMGNSGNVNQCHQRCLMVRDKGFNEGLNCISRNHIEKDNHRIGIELETYTNVLFYRNLIKEHDMLLEVASRLK